MMRLQILLPTEVLIDEPAARFGLDWGCLSWSAGPLRFLRCWERRPACGMWHDA